MFSFLFVGRCTTLHYSYICPFIGVSEKNEIYTYMYSILLMVYVSSKHHPGNIHFSALKFIIKYSFQFVAWTNTITKRNETKQHCDDWRFGCTEFDGGVDGSVVRSLMRELTVDGDGFSWLHSSDDYYCFGRNDIK